MTVMLSSSYTFTKQATAIKNISAQLRNLQAQQQLEFYMHVCIRLLLPAASNEHVPPLTQVRVIDDGILDQQQVTLPLWRRCSKVNMQSTTT